MSCDNMKPYACGGSMNPNTVQNPCDRSLHFEGADNVTINQGVGIDLTEGVHAYDANGNEIEYTVEPDSIEKCEVGDHVITYTATGEGSRSVPTMCGETALYARACNIITEIKKRIITILQSANPIIRGLSDALIQPDETFAPLSGVTAEDANGNELTVSYSGRYTNTAEGDIATFDTPYAEPMVSLVADIEPIQDTSGGAPSPSHICPISGWDSVDVTRTGKNLLAKAFEHQSNVAVNKSNCFFAKAGTYTFSFTSIGSASTWRIGIYLFDSSGTALSDEAYKPIVGVDWTGTYWRWGSNVNNKTYQLSIVEDCYIRFVFIAGDTSSSMTAVGAQLEVGSSATTYEPYQGQTYQTTLPQTVYGGTLDVVSGVLTVDRAYASLENAMVYSQSGDYTLYRKPNNPFAVNISGGDAVSNVTDKFGNIPSNPTETKIQFSTGGSGYIYASVPNDFDIGTVVAVYELATPTTITLTPTQIDSLLGRNNVWSDSGDVTVWYVDEIPQSAFSYPVRGRYTIMYTAEDECGNRTEEDRIIQVGAETYRTVIYEDKTLIINESSYDQATNRQLHGVATAVYPPLDADHDYVFYTTSGGGSPYDVYWYQNRNDIKSVKIGSPIKPTNTAFWFNSCDKITEMDFTNMDTSDVTEMGWMFFGCSELKQIEFGDSFDTGNVFNFAGTFQACSELESADLSEFDTSSATLMGSMFNSDSSLKTIYASDAFVTDNVTSSSDMFSGCTSLVGGSGTVFDQNKTDAEYARIDNPPDEPGYFTSK